MRPRQTFSIISWSVRWRTSGPRRPLEPLGSELLTRRRLGSGLLRRTQSLFLMMLCLNPALRMRQGYVWVCLSAWVRVQGCVCKGVRVCTRGVCLWTVLAHGRAARLGSICSDLISLGSDFLAAVLGCSRLQGTRANTNLTETKSEPFGEHLHRCFLHRFTYACTSALACVY